MNSFYSGLPTASMLFIQSPIKKSGFVALSPPAHHAGKQAASVFTPVETPKKGSLGTYTKSPATRSDRYYLQSVARRLLPAHRVSNCLRKRINKSESVKILISEYAAHYANLQHCGSVWACPVCAAKISEKRRRELAEAILTHRATGGEVYLMTLTNPHHKSSSLKGLLDGQKQALRSFFSGTRASKAIFESMGRIGHIRALELTHGANGWHPHYHILVFVKAKLSDERFSAVRDALARLWQRSCTKAGLPQPSMQHGLDLRDGSYADKYVGKWGLAEEMTKAHVKKGTVSSRTPWDLLRAAATGDVQAGRLFQEFVVVFKGARQLSWSRGLRKTLGLENETTDQDIVDTPEAEAKLVFELNIVQWAAICAQDMRAELLRAAENDVAIALEVVRCCVLMTTKEMGQAATKFV